MDREEWHLWLAALKEIAWTDDDTLWADGTLEFGALWHQELIEYGFQMGWVK